jgi:hypothetical protein
MNIGTLQGKIKSVQHLNHSVVIATAGEEDITISTVDPAKTIIVSNWNQGGSGSRTSTRLKNSTTVTVHIPDGGWDGKNVGIQVIEYY